jgi:hypothetical protein
VQSERAEGVVEELLHRLGHVAPAGVALVRVVAEVRGLEGAAHDLRDREDARDLAGRLDAGDQAREVVAPRAGEQLVELIRALGRVGPRPVQLAAVGGKREELVAVRAAQEPQPYARVCGRRGGLELRRTQAAAERLRQAAAPERWAPHADRDVGCIGT